MIVLVTGGEVLTLSLAGGRVFMRDGVMAQQDRFLQTSARRIRLDGHHA